MSESVHLVVFYELDILIEKGNNGTHLIEGVVLSIALLPSVSWGGPTWKQWWRELFSWKTMKNHLPESEKVSLEILIDESSSGRLSSHRPYSGAECDCLARSSSSPNKFYS